MRTSTMNENVEIKKSNSFLKELFHFALIIVLVVLPIRFFVAQPFVVVGTSMEPTFINKDYLIVDEISYRLNDPKRGDVIIFKFPGGEEKQKYFIKRIIGLPGETVDIKNGVVTIFNSKNPNGLVLNEAYIAEPPKNTLTVTVETGHYFVMGDNRDVSYDSRSWGTLEKSEIVGKAFLRLLPLKNADLLPGSNAGKYTNENN